MFGRAASVAALLLALAAALALRWLLREMSTREPLYDDEPFEPFHDPWLESHFERTAA